MIFNVFAVLFSLVSITMIIPFLGLLFGTINVESSNAYSKNKLPEIGISGFSALSLDKERLIGDAMMRQLRTSQPIIQDPVLIEYINHFYIPHVRLS